VTTETNELGDARAFSYDAAGRLTRRVDRRGWVRQFDYDNLSRNTAETWFDSTADADAELNPQNSFAFTYDAAGSRAATGGRSFRSKMNAMLVRKHQPAPGLPAPPATPRPTTATPTTGVLPKT